MKKYGTLTINIFNNNLYLNKIGGINLYLNKIG